LKFLEEIVEAEFAHQLIFYVNARIDVRIYLEYSFSTHFVCTLKPAKKTISLKTINNICKPINILFEWMNLCLNLFECYLF
jgi:hypothetical protein